MKQLHEIAIFQTVKSKVIISLFETVRLSVSISLRNLYNSLNSIKEKSIIINLGRQNDLIPLDGRTAPRNAAMDTFRGGSGGTSLGEWEHNNNSSNS